jgi:dienelactone hydrolase
LRWAAAFFACALCLGMGPASRLLHAAEFLTALSEGSAPPATERASASPVLEENIVLPGPDDAIRARLYRKAGAGPGRALVVAHGVHYRGIDERRLVPFARALAAQGLTVLTPELAELADYRISRQGVDVIHAAVRYLVQRPQLSGGERVGLLGFSFAGGLALIAASEPALRGQLAFVTSVGGHHDLGRVLNFLITNEIETPSGTVHEKAHDYGLAVLVYGNLEQFVPAVDLPTMRSAFRAWLQEDSGRARALAAALTRPLSVQLWQLLEARALQALAPDLRILLRSQSAKLAALSPRGRLAAIDAPVYLLHGTHDTVIPKSELSFASLELGPAAHDALISPLLEHVEVSRTARVRDKLALLAFLSHML